VYIFQGCFAVSVSNEKPVKKPRHVSPLLLPRARARARASERSSPLSTPGVHSRAFLAPAILFSFLLVSQRSPAACLPACLPVCLPACLPALYEIENGAKQCRVCGRAVDGNKSLHELVEADPEPTTRRGARHEKEGGKREQREGCARACAIQKERERKRSDGMG